MLSTTCFLQADRSWELRLPGDASTNSHYAERIIGFVINDLWKCKNGGKIKI